MPDDDDDLFDTQGPPEDVADLDDETRQLIGQLDEEEDYVTDRMVAEAPAVEGDMSPPLAATPNPEAGKPAEPPVTPTVKEVRRLTSAPELVTDEPVAVAPPPEPVVDLKKQFEQFDEIALEVIHGVRHDRQETQDAINLCRGEIAKAVSNGNNPSRMWVDNLTKGLEIKATINLTAIKALEAKAKLLAATKAGVQIQNNNLNQNANVTTTADDSLVNLLNDNPLDADGKDEF